MTNELPVSKEPVRPELSANVADKKPLIIVIVSAVVLLLFFALIIYLLGINEVTTATVRDISIILLGLVNMFLSFVLMVMAIVLVYLIMKINDLVQLINTEIRPVMEKANETADLAKETVAVVQNRTTFIGDQAVKPLVNLISGIGAIRAMIRLLFRI